MRAFGEAPQIQANFLKHFLRLRESKGFFFEAHRGNDEDVIEWGFWMVFVPLFFLFEHFRNTVVLCEAFCGLDLFFPSFYQGVAIAGSFHAQVHAALMMKRMNQV